MASIQQARRNVQAAVGKGSTGVILGIVAVLLLALLFIKLSDDVVEQEHIGFERGIALWIHGGASPTQTAIMLVVTEFGKNLLFAFTVLSLLIGAYIAWQARRRQQAGLAVAILDTIAPVVATIGAAGLSFVIKEIVGRTRPSLFPPLTSESGPSFPSGHTLTAVAFYGMCAFLLARPLRGWARAGVVLLAAIISGAVAYSRVYLGVHYPTDVLGSLIIGLAWLITLCVTLNMVENHLKGAHVIT
ncbi:MAG: phosphatase PAP2 family protein, partial [Ktedonobacterales bacterium]|nr:phosphatase PAP2 family protein [Ktedonobacterales bacterium]